MNHSSNIGPAGHEARRILLRRLGGNRFTIMASQEDRGGIKLDVRLKFFADILENRLGRPASPAPPA
jgi:hypothetical protein